MDQEQQLQNLRVAAEVAGVDVPELLPPLAKHVIMRNMRFHYLDWGTASRLPILFLHGGGLTAHTWDLVCLALRTEYHCLALDQRGHGDSEWSPGMDYTTEAHREDIEAFVSLLGLKDFLLVGMSLGGLNSIAYASRHSDRLRGLVLVDVGPDVRFDGAKKITDFMAMPAELESVEEFVQRAMLFNSRRHPELLRMSLLHNLRRTADGKWTWKYDRRHIVSRDLRAISARHRELWEDVPRISSPTLVVRCAESDVFLDEDADKLARALPNGRWVRIEESGHTVQGDNPRALIIEMRRFFGEIGA